MVKHAIITRLFYDDFDYFKQRIEIMNQTLIWSLKRQTNNNFIFIVLGDNYMQELRQMIDIDFINFTSAEDCLKFCKKENIQIQTRHDSDDYMSLDFVKYVQNLYKFKTGDNILLNFNAQHIEIETQKPLNKFTEYHDEKTSMFLTLFDDTQKIFIYHRPHNLMWKEVSKVMTIPAGYVYYGVHENQIMKVPIEKRNKLRQK